jgi:hypothetical protein
MICIPGDSTSRRQIIPSSVDFAAREEVLSRLERDYEQSLDQLDALNARLESCLAVLTGKPATIAMPEPAPAAQPSMIREAA